ncbi:MAG: sigma-54-dependent Fis family transcriptional regulator [Acidobacteria bacterium]|nr:sigma-54-dependent Fis family transcriptional regulator [Acidobacteriota bacterium]
MAAATRGGALQRHLRYTHFVIERKEVTAEVETRPEPVARDGDIEVPVPGLTVLWHPDLERVGERALLSGLALGREEAISRNAPVFAATEPPLAASAEPRPLADPFLSRQPIRLVPAGDLGAVRLVRDGSRTPVIAGGVPVHGALELGAADVERGTVLLLGNRVALLLHQVDPAPPHCGLPVGDLIGQSAAVIELRRELQRLAPLEVPVLLRGESGTGKELAARALHEGSPRARGPFLAVNLAAVPPALAAAELFGAARGAFTGADRARAGYFQLAAGGTLLLDEIGEASAEIQGLLLRALDSREIQEVGGGAPRRIDVRVITATDADLEAAAVGGRFRAPLLHRLAGYEIRLPALRQRRDDIGRLLLHFLRQELEALGAAARLRPGGGGGEPAADQPWMPAALVARLADFDWPGNVRQLRNVARHLAIAGHAAATVTWDRQLERLLHDPRGAPLPGTSPLSEPAVPPRRSRQRYRHAREVGNDELLTALRAHRFKLQPAAVSLGISRTALYELIERSPSLRKAGDLTVEQIENALAGAAGDREAAAASLEVSPRGLLRRIKGLGLHPEGLP